MKKSKPVITLIIFAVGLIVCLPFAIKAMGESHGLFRPADSTEQPTPETDAPTEPPVTEPPAPETTGGSSDTAADETTEAPTPGSETEPPVTTPPVTDPPETEPSIPVFGGFTNVDLSYFDDALFIGDSRTVGLRDYSVGNLKNATFFCSIGMSAGHARRDEYEYTSGVDASGVKTKYGKSTLDGLLAERKFGKIYIMVGINEMGDTVNNIVLNIRLLSEQIKRAQPDAIIFLCANMHVTKAYSDGGVSKYITNAKINEVNAGIAALADNTTSFYIDINERFDDADHALTAPYSGDGVHVYGKYYREWSLWLCTKGVVR